MKVKSIRFRSFRRFTDLTVEGIPSSARLVVLAGPNGVGKSSFFDGLTTWYKLTAWSNVQGSEEYNAKLGESEAADHFRRVAVELHDSDQAGGNLRDSTLYLRTAYRHEVDIASRTLEEPKASTLRGAHLLRAVDVDQSVTANYQLLLWKTFAAVYDNTTPDDATKAEIREKIVGRIRESLRRVFPDLTLERVGGLGRGHSFEFSKGDVSGFPYLNLSAGEKAVFDLLLDAIIKAEVLEDSIWCIDEPEIHVGTRAQGELLKELVSIVPERCQLFLATHSIGLLSEAVRLAQAQPQEVVFLDFGGHDFDQGVVIKPVVPDREFWKSALYVALDDLATLVAPKQLVLCEGGRDGYDAKCYRAIFAHEFPDVDFVSVGNNDDAQLDRLGLTSALQTIAEGTAVVRLRDRDLASATEVEAMAARGVRVLSRRHLESYLYDPEVLEAFCNSLERAELKEDVLQAREECVRQLAVRGKDVDDIKAIAGPFYVQLRRLLGLTNAGTTERVFALEHLAPLIKPGLAVYDELRRDIFG